jgi:hypothetical protein
MEEIEEVANTSKNKDVVAALSKGLEEAVKYITTRPKFATYEEDIEFNLSPYGKAYTLYLLCKEHSNFKTVAEYKILYEQATTEDLSEIDEAISWSQELEMLGNSDSPVS